MSRFFICSSIIFLVHDSPYDRYVSCTAVWHACQAQKEMTAQDNGASIDVSRRNYDVNIPSWFIPLRLLCCDLYNYLFSHKQSHPSTYCDHLHFHPFSDKLMKKLPDPLVLMRIQFQMFCEAERPHICKDCNHGSFLFCVRVKLRSFMGNSPTYVPKVFIIDEGGLQNRESTGQKCWLMNRLPEAGGGTWEFTSIRNRSLPR